MTDPAAASTADRPAGANRASPVRMLVAVAVIAAAGWFGVNAWLTPNVPDVAAAPLPAVVSFLANPRGFARLADADQDRYADGLKQRFREPDAHRELKRGLDACTDDQMDAIRKALEPLAFRRVIEQARAYRDMPREKRFEFLAEFDRRANDDAAWIKGFGDPERDMSGRISTGLPSNPEDLYKYIHTHTTPAERQLLEAFVADLKSYHAQKRTAARPPPSTQPASP